MDFKNEKSKIYLFGKIFLAAGVIILGIMFFMSSDKNSRLAYRIISIQQLLLSLMMVLLGTQEVVAKKNKSGYLSYLIGGFIFIVFIIRMF